MGQAQKKESSLELSEILYSELKLCQAENKSDIYFEIKKIDHLPFGFTSLKLLKNFTAQNQDKINEYIIRNVDSTHWVKLVEHPSFQRRKLQLVSTTDFTFDDNEEYFILSNGKKHGPYDVIEIRAMLEANQILLTDEVSRDNGQTWNKVFKIEGFDRRALKDANELPVLPEDVIHNSQPSNLPEHITNNALSLIAFSKKAKALSSSEKTANTENNINTKEFSVTKILLLFCAIFIGFIGFKVISQLKSPFEENSPTNKIGEQRSSKFDSVETLAPTENIKTTGKRSKLGEDLNSAHINNNARFEQKKLNPIIPKSKILNRKSFMDTQIYNEVSNDYASQSELDSYNNSLDNDSKPYEQDTVASQVSKEVYDDTLQENTNSPEVDNSFEELPLND